MAVAGMSASYNPLRDRALLAWSVLWSVVALAAFGIFTAIIPNPAFARGIAVEPFAIAVWLASAPLIGVVTATYFAPLPASMPVALGAGTARNGSTLGTLGGLAAFLAIGCPTCNKIALVLLGTSGAASIFGPIQPFIGAASLILLGATLAWRLRLRSRGGGCAIRGTQS